jgi:hypothetical protein
MKIQGKQLYVFMQCTCIDINMGELSESGESMQFLKVIEHALINQNVPWHKITEITTQVLIQPEAPRSLESLTWIKAAFNNETALWRPSCWESATAGHNFGKGPSKDYSIKGFNIYINKRISLWIDIIIPVFEYWKTYENSG